MKIFIADYLPLKNKGEEAILRGIQALYAEKYHDNIEFCIFGPYKKIKKEGNIKIYPYTWCYPDFINSKVFHGNFGSLMLLLSSILYIFGIYPFVSKISKHKELINDLNIADKIILSHDGFYNPYCAGLGLYLSKKGYSYSVLGAGFKAIEKYKFIFKKLDIKFFKNSELTILREQTAYDYLNNIDNNLNPILMLDMAFFCKKLENDVSKSIDIINKYNITLNQSSLNIGLTICENSISFAGSFNGCINKVDIHRNFIAQLLDKISTRISCKFFVLPHCIEEGKGDDIAIAEDIADRMKNNKCITIIKEDLPVNVLRHIIGHFDYMIGERTHSIINSISMNTPFFMFTCSSDFRSHDIIGKSCNLPGQIINLDNPNLEEILETVTSGIENRYILKKYLHKFNSIIENQRKELIKMI